jgi:hypothetical protein
LPRGARHLRKKGEIGETTVISTRRPSSRWAPHCVQQLGLRGLRRMPLHLKKTAVKPSNGMPQTMQLAASGGVLISKGALIATHSTSFAPLIKRGRRAKRRLGGLVR